MGMDMKATKERFYFLFRFFFLIRKFNYLTNIKKHLYCMLHVQCTFYTSKLTPAYTLDVCRV